MLIVIQQICVSLGAGNTASKFIRGQKLQDLSVSDPQIRRCYWKNHTSLLRPCFAQFF